MNKKILLVVDKRNWAYDHMANFIMKELSDNYTFHKMIAYNHVNNYQGKILKSLKHILNYVRSFFFESYDKNVEYDLVIYLWWNIPNILGRDNIQAKKTLKGIYTELFPPGNSIKFTGKVSEFIDTHIRPADGIIAGNQNILNFYDGYGIPVDYATGSTDISLFKYNRSYSNTETLRICWSGNPNRNFKGFYEYVKPAFELAKNSCPGLELHTRFDGPLETLPKFYENADIMINASSGDAGPGFIIDAGACGVPSISTNIGFASEIIKDYENGLIVERTVEAIASKIIEIYNDRNLLKHMSENIYNDVQSNWGHSSRALHWDNIFQKLLKG